MSLVCLETVRLETADSGHPPVDCRLRRLKVGLGVGEGGRLLERPRNEQVFVVDETTGCDPGATIRRKRSR